MLHLLYILACLALMLFIVLKVKVVPFGGMAGFEVVEFHATAPTNTLGTVIPTVNPGGASGQFQVRAFKDPGIGELVTAWEFNQAVGAIRIKGPGMIDANQGIRLRSGANSIIPLITYMGGASNRIASGQIITFDIAGSAVAGQIETGLALFYYSGSDVMNQNLIDAAGLTLRRSGLIGAVEVALNPGAGGGWTGGRAFNFSFQNFKGDKNYAILGATTDVICGGIGITGPCTGGFRYAIPTDLLSKDVGANWGPYLSMARGYPAILVMKGTDAGGTIIDCIQNQTGTAVNATILVEELLD